ncbi:MAG: RNB domain-containing ribonuclease [Acidobacteriaceae bacterium]
MARTPKHRSYPSSHDRSDKDLLARIARSAGRKAGYKQLVRELGLGGGRERRLLVEQLTRLAARGELTRIEDGLWSIPVREVSTNQEDAGPERRQTQGLWDGMEAAVRGGRERLVSGRLDLHRDGFGFVRPEARSPSQNRVEGAGLQPETGLRPAPKQQKQDDIFIPPNEIHGAMQGDLVLVDEALPGRDGRRSGRIARILTRRNPTIVGIFHYANRHQRNDFETLKGNFVTPWDDRLGGPIAIADGDEVIGSVADSPHRMLGAEARKTLQAHESKDPKRPLEGLAVDVEILSFPGPGRPARGRVVEVLGPPDGFGVDVEIVIRKHHIPHAFPAPVLAEAEERALETVATLAPEVIENREDFRGLPIVTIDGETARDFDDAVLVRRMSNGNSELQVHIADVSWYVRPGSAVDTEARLRGTSVYFPDRAVPMLPHALSSGMCSLLPNEDRLVLSCIMEIDSEGEIVRYRLAESIIRSVRRMTYTSVQQCLNAGKAADLNAHRTGLSVANRGSEPGFRAPTAEDLAERERIDAEHPDLPRAFDAMLDLALRLNKKRVRRGSIDFDLPEPIVEFDPDGNMKAIVRSERGWAHRLIEEFMLSANECVAHWLEGRGLEGELDRKGVASIYRIHEMPDPKRIVEFEETAAGFGHSLGLGTLAVRKVTMKADRRESRQRAARGRDSRGAQQHEIPESIPVTPQMYQRLVRRISGTPEERILAYLMLRSLKQARYAEKNEGHFALASPSYTHFTSPIRRYPDLIVHRLVRALLRDGVDPRGGEIRSDDWQPWAAELARGKHGAGPLMRQKRAHEWGTQGVAGAEEGKYRGVSTAAQKRASGREDNARGDSNELQGSFTPLRTTSEIADPIAAEELSDIAVESSQAERRAADAERELIEWKKIRFMADKIGDDFPAVILSCTKYGFFVELDDMFIEGLVPMGSLVGDYYSYRDTDRTIVGARTGHVFALGQRVHVLLDRIDRQQRRLQFALLPGTEPKVVAGAQGRGGKSEAKKAKGKEKKVGGKAKGRGRRKW